MRLTAATIRSLQLPAGKDDKIFFDSDLAGFGFRLRSSGAKTWLVQYAIEGRTRRVIIGKVNVFDPGQAREEAKKILARVQLGEDPAGEKAETKSRSGETFKACLDLYLARRRNEQLRAATMQNIERHLDRNFKALHGIRIDKVDRRAVALELARLTTETGPVEANRSRSSLVKFLNFCCGEGVIDSNPATLTNRNPEQSRDRVLADSELRTIWLGLGEGDYADILRLLLLTGCRQREISDLTWDELDLDRAVIELPATRTKNKKRHTLPLSAPALEF